MKFGVIVRRRKKSNFNPSHEQVQVAMGEYFKNGGKLTKIESLKSSYLDFMAGKSAVGTADDFLLGQ